MNYILKGYNPEWSDGNADEADIKKTLENITVDKVYELKSLPESGDVPVFEDDIGDLRYVKAFLWTKAADQHEQETFDNIEGGNIAEENAQAAAAGTKAMRFNAGKVQLSYILDADIAIAGACRVFEFGAQKYARGNWKKGLDANEVKDSLLRHLTAMNNGEILDPESGLPHADHVTCNAIFLATFSPRG